MIGGLRLADDETDLAVGIFANQALHFTQCWICRIPHGEQQFEFRIVLFGVGTECFVRSGLGSS